MNKIDSRVELNNGVMMPWFGLGVWQAEEGDTVINAVQAALENGYRSIDTAAIYRNEAGVGEGIRRSGVPSSEIFVTTKVWNSDQGYESTLRAFDSSVDKLGIDIVDLYLIHWPVAGKFKDTWKALESLYRDGRVKAIGVSNFLKHHLADLLDDAEITPAVNQIEYHPYLVQPELKKYCEDHGIRVEAWSPLMQGKIFQVPEILSLAEKYGKTPAQIVLRWDIQGGVVTIPKSVNPERIISNSEIFDFELDLSDIDLINGLDRFQRVGPDPDNFDF